MVRVFTRLERNMVCSTNYTAAYTNSTPRFRERGSRHHGSQETDAEYSNDEYSSNPNNLDNVRDISSSGARPQYKNTNVFYRAPTVETLTDFIQEAVHILNTYEDTAFEDFFHVLDNEIRKYHYSGCKFSELTQNPDTRRLLARSLKLIRGKPVSFTKANINELAATLKDENYDRNVKDLLDYINSLYRNTELNLQSVLSELKYYRNTKTVRTHNNLVQVIRSALRTVLFNPYTELDTHTRKGLKGRIETFWTKIKNHPTSSVEVNDVPYTDPEIKPASNNFKVSENIIDGVNNLRPYSTNDPQANPENKRKKIVSIETYNEQFQDEEIENDGSSNESGKQIKSYNTDEILSGQSFDSSSNSIKNSQERQVEYNTQRYMTLYTEEISYKPWIAKKKEFIPLPANIMTKRPKVKQRSTPSPSESDVSVDKTDKVEMLRANHDLGDTKLVNSNSNQDTESGLALESKYKSIARDKPQKQGKAYESRSRSKPKNVEIVGQYDAVINVQLANTKLLKSLGIFKPLKTDTKSEGAVYRKSGVQTETIPSTSTIRPGSNQTETEIQAEIPSALTGSPSNQSKKNTPLNKTELSDIKENMAPERQKQYQKYLKHTDNSTTGADDFNTYVIKRINAMEDELNELKQMKTFNFRSRMNDNNSDEFEASNVTDKTQVLDNVDSKRKDMKGTGIESLSEEEHDLNIEEVNNRHKITTTKSSTTSNETDKQKKKVENNTTNIENNNKTQVTNKTSKISVKVTEKLNRELINNNEIKSPVSLANNTKYESNVTTSTTGLSKTAMPYLEPSYYNSLEDNRPTVRNSQFEPFLEHVNDGLDLHI